MSEFDLDLRTAEDHLEALPTEEVVLGVLDGSTPPEEWIMAVDNGNVLVLAVEGDLNALAAGFAREIKDMGGELMHFREFLIVSPAETAINTDRL
ncbi:MAG: DUF5779 family protein [Halobacteriota archaeon]